MYKIRIDLQPKPTPRIRFDTETKKIYYESWYTSYKTALSLLIKAKYSGNITDKNVSIKLSLYKNVEVSNKLYGDIDNIAKGILDAATGIIYFDDKQVTSLSVTKYESAREHIDLEVYIEGE